MPPTLFGRAMTRCTGLVDSIARRRRATRWAGAGSRAEPGGASGAGPSRAPQPIAAVDALRQFAECEPWLASPAARVQCTWERSAPNGDRFVFYLVRNDDPATLGILLHEGQLDGCRLYPTLALAAVDSLLWARDIQLQPLRRLAKTGLDADGRLWSLRVLRRQQHWELQVARGGLIPWTGHFKRFEDAIAAADECVRAFEITVPQSSMPASHQWRM